MWYESGIVPRRNLLKLIMLNCRAHFKMILLASAYSLGPLQVTGTGKAGRILKSDVLAFMEASKAENVPQPKPPPPAMPVTFPQTESREVPIRGCNASLVKTISLFCLAAQNVLIDTWRENTRGRTWTVVPMHPSHTGVQRLMFQSMTASLQIPHFLYCDEVEMDALKTLRAQVKATQPDDISISFMPFLIKVVSFL